MHGWQVPDPVKRFRLCVRAKRGLFDSGQPGALNIDQASAPNFRLVKGLNLAT